jgi:hypothetical protein
MFKLINSDIFPLPGAPGWIHLATVHRGIREYMCFRDNVTGKTYIEEITGGSLEFIEDDSLVKELYNYLVHWSILRVGKF